MSKNEKSKNDSAWEALFAQYDILKRIDNERFFMISAEQIRARREPRLMAKFDHKINLPTLFSAHGLSILPVSRGKYCISHFDAYFPFEPSDPVVHPAALPGHIQSIDPVHINSESVAVNCALAAGIFADFAEDEHLLPTVSGRMGSGLFDFEVASLRGNSPLRISVNNAQIEIDAALEGRESLLLVEAKNDISSDFIIRQLFYPVRTWSGRIAKKIRPVFLVYSNSIFRLYEYAFGDIFHYNSIKLIKQKNYSIESIRLTKKDIVDAFQGVAVCPEPEVPFPQADNFPRVINLCELLSVRDLDKDEITREYAFDARQTNYYADAGRYLGFIEKRNASGQIFYSLSKTGRSVFGLRYGQRQIALCTAILQHRIFMRLFEAYLASGILPGSAAIVQCMKEEPLYRLRGESTYRRRASTINSWLQWIVGLWDVGKTSPQDGAGPET